MKQVLQNLLTGAIEVAYIPSPSARPRHLLIQTCSSLISAGTERMLVEFGKGSLIAKAKSQPDKVRKVLDKIHTDGLLPTLEAVFSRLDEPLSLGYCNAGVVVEVGQEVNTFKPGDRVISNGPHAEMVCAPQNLCAKIPRNVSDEQAAFTVLGSIGLQGIRLLNPTLGETIVVTGLGLIGLLSVQLLVANGCRVIGIDPDPNRSEMARRFGAETIDLTGGVDPISRAMAFTNGRGVDGVLITASTKSNEVIHQAAEMCRQRGRIVLVGVVGLELKRTDFYKKELSFQVSCSYGPGRYDPQYEEKGHDYPLGYVRWTEQRNFEAVLDLMAANRLNVLPLISHRFELARAEEAYRMLTEGGDGLGMILTYPGGESLRGQTVKLNVHAAPAGVQSDQVTVGMIGAGNFTKLVLLPALKRCPVRLRSIASSGGVSGAHIAGKFGFEQTTTDYHAILADPDVNLIMITTRHNLHARMVVEALKAGKHVFVEKPLCLSMDELEEIKEIYSSTLAHRSMLHVMVGFNRRFSPHAEKMRTLLFGRTEPLTMSMMVNAGVIPPGSWTHDPAVGGGRIIGEGCHWIDLMAFLADAPVVRVAAMKVGEAPGLAVREDKTSITLSFADGSIGTLHYFGNGAKSYPKETLEVFCEGKVLRLDNFHTLTGCGWSGFRRMRLWRQDKGHRAEIARFINTVAEGGAPLIPFDRIENITRATLASVTSAETGQIVVIE